MSTTTVFLYVAAFLASLVIIALIAGTARKKDQKQNNFIKRQDFYFTEVQNLDNQLLKSQTWVQLGQQKNCVIDFFITSLALQTNKKQKQDKEMKADFFLQYFNFNNRQLSLKLLQSFIGAEIKIKLMILRKIRQILEPKQQQEICALQRVFENSLVTKNIDDVIFCWICFDRVSLWQKYYGVNDLMVQKMKETLKQLEIGSKQQQNDNDAENKVDDDANNKVNDNVDGKTKVSVDANNKVNANNNVNDKTKVNVGANVNNTRSKITMTPRPTQVPALKRQNSNKSLSRRLSQISVSPNQQSQSRSRSQTPSRSQSRSQTPTSVTTQAKKSPMTLKKKQTTKQTTEQTTKDTNNKVPATILKVKEDQVRQRIGVNIPQFADKINNNNNSFYGGILRQDLVVWTLQGQNSRNYCKELLDKDNQEINQLVDATVNTTNFDNGANINFISSNWLDNIENKVWVNVFNKMQQIIDSKLPVSVYNIPELQDRIIDSTIGITNCCFEPLELYQALDFRSRQVMPEIFMTVLIFWVCGIGMKGSIEKNTNTQLLHDQLQKFSKDQLVETFQKNEMNMGKERIRNNKLGGKLVKKRNRSNNNNNNNNSYFQRSRFTNQDQNQDQTQSNQLQTQDDNSLVQKQAIADILKENQLLKEQIAKQDFGTDTNFGDIPQPEDFFVEKLMSYGPQENEQSQQEILDLTRILNKCTRDIFLDLYKEDPALTTNEYYFEGCQYYFQLLTSKPRYIELLRVLALKVQDYYQSLGNENTIKIQYKKGNNDNQQLSLSQFINLFNQNDIEQVTQLRTITVQLRGSELVQNSFKIFKCKKLQKDVDVDNADEQWKTFGRDIQVSFDGGKYNILGDYSW